MKKQTKIIAFSAIIILLIGAILIFAIGNLENSNNYIDDESELDYDDNLNENSNLELDISKSEITEYTEVDYNIDLTYESYDAIYVNLNEISEVYEITSAGTYVFSGELEGQIIVESEDEESVKLILNNIEISSSENSPIAIEAAEETIIFLADGTTNYITDNSDYIDPDTNEDATTAAIFSRDDLYVSGSGELIINSKNKNGIQGKDQIVINSGTISVDAAKEAIKTKDYIIIEDGNLDLTAGEDGISVTEEEEEDKGWIEINGGTISINSQYDGLTAKTYLIINDGDFDITTTTTDTTKSAKGIKTDYYLEINGGTISINSKDDGLHSNNEIVINKGDLTISSGDDGIHADELVEINDGTIDIQKCYEGIEANEVIINDGTIDISSSDDGINSPGGKITINDGTITIAAAESGAGDGLDSNGVITINGGDIVIIMPSSYRDYSSIDYDRTFSLTGGQVRILNTDGTYTEITESNVGSASGMMGGMGGEMQQPSGGMNPRSFR